MKEIQKKLLKSYRVNKNLRPAATAYEPEQKHKVTPGIPGWLNYLPLQCLLDCWFKQRSKKTSKLRYTGLCVGNSPVTGEFPAQKASNAENVSIWWRHHESHKPETDCNSSTIQYRWEVPQSLFGSTHKQQHQPWLVPHWDSNYSHQNRTVKQSSQTMPFHAPVPPRQAVSTERRSHIWNLLIMTQQGAIIMAHLR